MTHQRGKRQALIESSTVNREPRVENPAVPGTPGAAQTAGLKGRIGASECLFLAIAPSLTNFANLQG